MNNDKMFVITLWRTAPIHSIKQIKTVLIQIFHLDLLLLVGDKEEGYSDNFCCKNPLDSAKGSLKRTDSFSPTKRRTFCLKTFLPCL